MSAECYALNELEAEARTLIRCPICLEKFRVPKVLPCQHTFCLGCLEGCFVATQAQRLVTVSNFPCPTCRKTCYVPLGGLDQLPTDIKMKQIAELWEKLESSGLQANANQLEPVEDGGGNSALCGVCIYQKVRQFADSFCMQCTKALCSKCLSQHSRTSLFRNHCVISMAGQGEQSSLVGDQCNEHRNEVELYYCRECQRSLCSVCVLLPEHETHAIRKRTFASNEQGAYNLSDQLEDLELRSGKLARAIKSVDYLKKEIARLTNESEKDIESSFRQAKQKLKDAKLKLIEEVRVAKEERLGLVTLTEKKFLQEQNSVKKLNDSLRKKLSCKDLTPREEEAMKKLAEDLQKPQSTLDSSLRHHILFFPDIDVRLGKTRVQPLEGIDPSLFPSEGDLSGNPPVLTVGATEKNPGNSGKDSSVEGGLKRSAKECHGRNPASVASRTENENQKDALLQTLARTLSIRASAAAAKHQSFSVVGTKHAAEDSIRYDTPRDDFINCRDCCFLDNDQLFVTGQNRSSEGLIKIFNARTLEVVRSFDRSTKMRPWSLTSCQDPLHPSSVLVTDQEGNTVNLVGPDGTVKELPMSPGTPRIKKPTGIALTRTGQYVITDTASANPRANRIGLYALRSGKLQLVRRLAGFGSGDGEVLGANFVTVDSGDRVLVSDSESRNIKVFNLRGEQLLKFSSCGPDGQELLPQGLAVDGAMNIFLVDQSTESVALYSPDGNLMNSSIIRNLTTAWGISFNVDQSLIAVATDLGPKVFTV